MTEQNIADINWLVRLRRDLGFCLLVVIVSVCSQNCYATPHSFPKESSSLVVIIVGKQFGPRNKAMQAHVIQSYCFGFFLAWV